MHQGWQLWVSAYHGAYVGNFHGKDWWNCQWTEAASYFSKKRKANRKRYYAASCSQFWEHHVDGSLGSQAPNGAQRVACEVGRSTGCRHYAKNAEYSCKQRSGARETEEYVCTVVTTVAANVDAFASVAVSLIVAEQAIEPLGTTSGSVKKVQDKRGCSWGTGSGRKEFCKSSG